MSEPEEHILTVLATSSAIFVSLIAFIVYLILLYQKNIAAKQRELFKTALFTQENERERIARDLHDQVGPMLSGLKFRIDNVEDEQEKEQSMLMIDKIIDDLRNASYNLMPKVLYTFGLVDAIEDCCLMLSGADGMEIRFTNHLSENLAFSKDVQLNMFRAVQEIINNAVKYSGSLLVTVELLMQDDFFVVLISDHGKGFDAESVRGNKESGIGIQNIYIRMELIGGSCILATAPDQGTMYSLKLHRNKL